MDDIHICTQIKIEKDDVKMRKSVQIEMVKNGRIVTTIDTITWGNVTLANLAKLATREGYKMKMTLKQPNDNLVKNNEEKR